jgi:RimJ/RimL family protein N-acetyltransferase
MAMERAGFVREGVLRGFEKMPTERWDMVSFSMLHDDEQRPSARI